MVAREQTVAVVAGALLVFAYTAGVALPGVGLASGTDTDIESNAQQQSGFSGDLDLGDADTKVVGAERNDTSGWSVATGDANGDGVTDLLVGAVRDDTGGEGAGAAYLFYGPVDTGTFDVTNADVTFVGEEATDAAGYSVAIGDVDGDASEEVVVGAPGHAADAGAVYAHEVTDDPTGEVSLEATDHKFVGEEPGDNAGRSVAVPPNETDGSGLVVGAPSHDDRGAAYMVRDPADGEQDLSDAQAKFVGENADDEAGAAVAFVGDADDDGAPDAVVGAPGRANDTGAAYLLSNVGEPSGTFDLGDVGVRMDGINEGDRAGAAVAHAGDFDDDGVDDVAVGAPFNDDAGTNAGAAYVVLGSSGLSEGFSLSDADVALAGEASGDRAGFAVAAAGSGDVTCDEVDDLLVGAPGNDSAAPDAGAVYLVEGDAAPPSAMALSDAGAKFHGEAENDQAGYALADGGDLNADGDEDVVVSAPFHDTGQDEGATYVVHGDCPEVAKTDTPTDRPTDTPTDKPTKTATDKPTKTPTDRPIETKTDRPTDTPTDRPTETKTDKPTETATDRPTDTPTDKPPDTPTDRPTKTPTDRPTDTPTDKPTDKPTETATDRPTATKTDKPTDTPTDRPTKTPTDTPGTSTDTPGTPTDTPGTPTDTPGTPTDTPPDQPGQHAISFIAFCYEEGDESTIHITNDVTDDDGEPIEVSYEVESGDDPIRVVHKAGQPIYEQPGGPAGTVVAGAGTDVTDSRSPQSPCAEGEIALKFEEDQGELTESTTKSFPEEENGSIVGFDDGRWEVVTVALLSGALVVIAPGIVGRRFDE